MTGWLSCDCWSYDEPTRMRTKSNPCPTQMRDLRTLSSLLGVECWYSKRFEKCCSKSSSIKCSKRLKFYWFCVLLWDKSQCWANSENVQTWQHFWCWDFFKWVNRKIAWKGSFQVNSTPRWSQKPWIQSRPTRSTQPCPVLRLQNIQLSTALIFGKSS